jgi:hypothetical protein
MKINLNLPYTWDTLEDYEKRHLINEAIGELIEMRRDYIDEKQKDDA